MSQPDANAKVANTPNAPTSSNAAIEAAPAADATPPLQIQIWTERRADGWYAIGQLPSEPGEPGEPDRDLVENGPYPTDLIAIEVAEDMLASVACIMAKNIVKITKQTLTLSDEEAQARADVLRGKVH